MSEAIDIAVVGATGAVGEAMMEILEQREFPVGKLSDMYDRRLVIVISTFGAALFALFAILVSRFKAEALPLVYDVHFKNFNKNVSFNWHFVFNLIFI